ncbi:MAG: diguanylate cyclase, partial [Oscillospiraceae bacterium]|nr:diguanylate cyclase [Oscillospiraceae bacterium]
MFEIIREHQLNIMLALCAVCCMMAGLLLFTQFLSDRRKWILILMELAATFLLGFDRAAYIYKGDMRPVGAFMVRISNFMVFFLTS